MFRLSIISSVTLALVGLLSNGVSASAFTVETIKDGLFQPYGIDLDNNNNLIVTLNGSLVKIDGAGNLETIASLTPGIASGVLVDGPDFVVVENATGSLLRITSNGQKTTLATGLNDPAGVALQNNDFIVGEFGAGIGGLKRVSPGGVISSIVSTGIGGPTEIVVDGDNFWVADFALGRLLNIAGNGNITEIATGLGQPLDIEFDGKDFIVTDFAQGFNTPGNGRILRVSKLGQVTTLITGIGNPSGITLQGSDVIFTDIVSGRVARINNLLAVPESSTVLGLLMLGIGFSLTIKRNVN